MNTQGQTGTNMSPTRITRVAEFSSPKPTIPVRMKKYVDIYSEKLAHNLKQDKEHRTFISKFFGYLRPCFRRRDYVYIVE
jgi:hypothetical protein